MAAAQRLLQKWEWGTKTTPDTAARTMRKSDLSRTNSNIKSFSLMLSTENSIQHKKAKVKSRKNFFIIFAPHTEYFFLNFNK